MTGPRGLAKGDTGQDHLAWGVSWAPAEGGRYVRSRESWSGQNPESSTHRNPHRRWGCWAQRREGLTWGQVPAQPELGLWAPGRHPYSSASNCLPQKGWQTSLGPGPLGGNADGAADDNAPPIPSRGPAHILGSILAGLLRGQLSNQQGLQELADKTEVLVEGVEGVLRESRQSGGQTDRQLEQHPEAAGRDKVEGLLTEG